MITFLIAAGTFLGGAAAAVGSYFGWQRRQQTRAQGVSEMAAELQVHRTDDLIEAAIKKAMQPIWRSIENNTQITEDMRTKLTTLWTVQFGGNGGGIREAVNATDKKVDGVVNEQARQGQRIAKIEGHLGISS